MRKLILLVVLAGCVRAPKKNYTNEEIKRIDELEELMRVQAKTMDPEFKKRDQPSFTDAEYGELAAAGQRIQVTSQVLLDRFASGKAASFGPYASNLHTHAEELAAAADAKDPAKVKTALGAMKDTCAACHRENR